MPKNTHRFRVECISNAYSRLIAWQIDMGIRTAKTPKQSEALDREINALDIRGYTGAEIARRLEMTPQAVSARLKKLNARAITDRAERVAQELRTLDTLLTEALDAWEKSKEPLTTTTVSNDSSKSKGMRRTEEQTGNPAHLANALKAAESRRKLLGLDAPARQEHSGPDGAPIQIIEVVTPEAD
jgi:predicted transcriptional regulator